MEQSANALCFYLAYDTNVEGVLMNMNYYRLFDAPANRENTECAKWDLRAEFGNADALPMWVADMDFRTAESIIEALKERVSHGVFGYARESALDKQAVANWLERRHGQKIEPESVLYSPGVVDSMYHVLRALFSEGARVIIQPPVYGPFRGMTEKAGMRVIENPLIERDGCWQMDFDGLEDALKAGAEALMLCSPHNPVGRVWSMGELKTLVELCSRYGAKIISDEIHADFELRGAKHIPILALAPDAVMLISATKTFNLAALRHSTIICEDADARAKIKAELSNAMANCNLFGRLATRYAYETGAEWLDALNEYLTDGRDLLIKGFANIPGIRATRPQGTYLMWLDARELNMDDKALMKFFTEDCGVILSEGAFFGAQGAGHARLNFATSHKNLELALERIEKAVRRS